MDAGATFAEKGARRDDFTRLARHMAGFLLDKILPCVIDDGSPREPFLIG
jgi:hypothetical protein